MRDKNQTRFSISPNGKYWTVVMSLSYYLLPSNTDERKIPSQMLEQIARFLVAKRQRVNRINRWWQMGTEKKKRKEKKTCKTQ